MFPTCCPICFNENIKANRSRGFISHGDLIFELPFPSWYFECEDCTYQWDPGLAIEQKEDFRRIMNQSLDSDNPVDFY